MIAKVIILIISLMSWRNFLNPEGSFQPLVNNNNNDE